MSPAPAPDGSLPADFFDNKTSGSQTTTTAAPDGSLPPDFFDQQKPLTQGTSPRLRFGMSDDDIIRSYGYDPATIKKAHLYSPNDFSSYLSDPSRTDLVSKLADSPLGGLGMGALNTVNGLGQFATHVLNKVGIASDADRQYMDLATRVAHDDYDQNIRRGQPHSNIPEALGSIVATPAVGGSSIGGIALGGAIAGMSQPVYENGPQDSYVVPKLVQGVEGGVTGAVTGAVLHGAANAPRVVRAVNAVRKGTVDNPLQTLVQALKPRSSAVNFDRSLTRAVPDIKDAEAFMGKPISGLEDAIQAVKLAKNANRARWNQFMGPAAERGQLVDMTPVADAMNASIPDRFRFENTLPDGSPNAALQSRLNTSNVYRGAKVPVQKAEQLLHDTNAELDAYYAKYPASQRADLRANPETAGTVAQADAIRNALYSTFDDPSLGLGTRELNLRYGALMDMEDALMRRKNVAARQQPQSLQQQVSKARAAGKVALGLGKMVFTKGATGLPNALEGLASMSASNWLKEQQTTDALIKNAFASYKGGPNPSIVGPVPPRIAGLLNKAPVVTPPPADTSFVRGVSGPESAVLGFPQSQQKLLPDVYNPVGGQMRKPWTESGGMPQNAGQPTGGGVVVPDILGRSTRGQGTPRPLLPAAHGAPTGGVTQPTRFGRPTYRGQPGMNPQQSTVSGPGAKTVGPPAAIPLPPAGTFKNPYR